MKFALDHTSIDVLDLERSLAFYEQALGLHEVRRIEAEEEGLLLVFLADDEENHRIELTWRRGRTKPCDLGDNAFHLAVRTDDSAAAHALHAKMGCISREYPDWGLYFIADPDGHLIEVLPRK